MTGSDIRSVDAARSNQRTSNALPMPDLEAAADSCNGQKVARLGLRAELPRRGSSAGAELAKELDDAVFDLYDVATSRSEWSSAAAWNGRGGNGGRGGTRFRCAS